MDEITITNPEMLTNDRETNIREWVIAVLEGRLATASYLAPEEGWPSKDAISCGEARDSRIISGEILT